MEEIRRPRWVRFSGDARGHNTAELAARGKIFSAVINALIGDFFRHGEEGYPGFGSWPGTDRWTHQQAYKSWLFRAYQGGNAIDGDAGGNAEDYVWTRRK